MKLGIAGTGKITEEALYAMSPLREIAVTALFARPHSRDKGEALARRYAIPAVYTDYEAMLDRADTDTVYIALVNSAHYAYAKKALLKGKHVILEKPFTGTLAETEDLIRLARERGLFLFEAVTVLHGDVIEKMRRDLPKLGGIRLMLANYSQYSSRYDRYLNGGVEPSFDPALFGGALRDINVYNIHYAAALFGAPRFVRYFPNRGHNGVDTSGALIMTYDGFSAVCTGAKDSDSPCFVSIQGEKGFMRIDGKPNAAPNLTTVTADAPGDGLSLDASGARVRPTRTETFIPEPPHHRMTREFRDFARIIAGRNTREAERLLQTTLDVMRILTFAEQSAPERETIGG